MKMRAKFRLSSVDTTYPGQEKLSFYAVGGDKVDKGYPPDGSDEDNNYAKWSPQGELTLTVANPALLGQFKQDQKFYLDFTPADEPAAAPVPSEN